MSTMEYIQDIYNKEDFCMKFLNGVIEYLSKISRISSDFKVNKEIFDDFENVIINKVSFPQAEITVSLVENEFPKVETKYLADFGEESCECGLEVEHCGECLSKGCRTAKWDFPNEYFYKSEVQAVVNTLFEIQDRFRK